MSGDAAGRVRDLVDLARSETGLADFGGDEWREGLDVLVGSAMRESTFNEYGEQMFYGAITRALKTRLEVDDALLNARQAEGGLARAKRDYLVALTNLRYAQGTL